MLRMLLARLRHGRRTIDFPPPMPALPARYRGRPVLDGASCAAELAGLGNVVFDLARFGVQFVASPRHADGLLITGAVSQNMRLALEKTYDAIPEPRLVIAVGACAISGGPFRGSPEVLDGVP